MSIRKIFLEELNKADKSDIESMIKDMLDDFDDDVKDDVRKMIEDNDTERMVRDYIQHAMEQYHKVLWQRRSNWSGAI